MLRLSVWQCFHHFGFLLLLTTQVARKVANGSLFCDGKQKHLINITCHNGGKENPIPSFAGPHPSRIRECSLIGYSQSNSPSIQGHLFLPSVFGSIRVGRVETNFHIHHQKHTLRLLPGSPLCLLHPPCSRSSQTHTGASTNHYLFKRGVTMSVLTALSLPPCKPTTRV